MNRLALLLESCKKFAGTNSLPFLKRHLLTLGLMLLGVYLYPVRVMAPGFSLLPGTLGDARLVMYFLEHGYQALILRSVSYWNAPYFYPQPIALAYSDTHLGSLPFYCIFRMAGMDTEAALQAWVILLFALSYLTCVYALNQVGFPAAVASIAAYPFSFSLPFLSQWDHLAMLEHFVVPLAMIWFYKWLRGGGICYLLAAGAAFVWQTYCYIYFGYFLALALAAFLFAYLFLQTGLGERAKWRQLIPGSTKQWSLAAVSSVALLLLLVYLFEPYRRVFQESGGWPRDVIAQMSPHWPSYFTVNKNTLLWSGLEGTSAGQVYPWEHRLFPGLLSVLAALFAAPLSWGRRYTYTGRFALVSALTLAILVAFTTVWGDQSLYLLFIKRIPAFASMRAIGRIVFIELFFVAVCIAVAMSRLHEMLTDSRLRNAALGLICGALVLDGAFDARDFAYKKETHRQRVNGVLAGIKQEIPKNAVLAFLPPPSADRISFIQLDAMFAAMRLGIPTVNGISGMNPPGYTLGESPDLAKTQAWVVYARDHLGQDLTGRLVLSGSKLRALPVMTSCKGPLKTFRAVIQGQAHMIARAGDKLVAPVQLKNMSNETWCTVGEASGRLTIGVVTRWLANDGHQLQPPNNATIMSSDVAPGQTQVHRPIVEVPQVRGNYFLEFDMLQQGVAFFRTQGSAAWVTKVTVLGPPLADRKTPSSSTCDANLAKPLAELRMRSMNRTAKGLSGLLELENTGNESWCAPTAAGDALTVGVVARWLRNGKPIAQPIQVGLLTYDVPPGGHAISELNIPLPPAPDLELDLDLFQSGVLWFRDFESKPLVLKASDWK